MPLNQNIDEPTWERAKEQAKKQNQEKNYAYVMSIYKTMMGENTTNKRKGNKMKERKDIFTYKRIFKEEEKTDSNYLVRLLGIADQIKVFHLQTFGFASHTALGTFYDAITLFTDSFAEKRIGIEQRPSVNGLTISLKDYKEEEVLAYVNECLNYFKSLRKEVSGNSDLENLVDEIIGSTNQLKYLLTLK